MRLAGHLIPRHAGGAVSHEADGHRPRQETTGLLQREVRHVTAVTAEHKVAPCVAELRALNPVEHSNAMALGADREKPEPRRVRTENGRSDPPVGLAGWYAVARDGKAVRPSGSKHEPPAVRAERGEADGRVGVTHRAVDHNSHVLSFEPAVLEASPVWAELQTVLVGRGDALRLRLCNAV